MRNGIVAMGIGVGLVATALALTIGVRETAICAGFVGGLVCVIWGIGQVLDAREPKVEGETPDSPVKPGL